jgi:hypothetical protein
MMRHRNGYEERIKIADQVWVKAQRTKHKFCHSRHPSHIWLSGLAGTRLGAPEECPATLSILGKPADHLQHEITCSLN